MYSQKSRGAPLEIFEKILLQKYTLESPENVESRNSLKHDSEKNPETTSMKVLTKNILKKT